MASLKSKKFLSIPRRDRPRPASARYWLCTSPPPAAGFARAHLPRRRGRRFEPSPSRCRRRAAAAALPSPSRCRRRRAAVAVALPPPSRCRRRRAAVALPSPSRCRRAAVAVALPSPSRCRRAAVVVSDGLAHRPRPRPQTASYPRRSPGYWDHRLRKKRARGARQPAAILPQVSYRKRLRDFIQSLWT